MIKKNQGTKKQKRKDQPYKPTDNTLLITVVETTIPTSEVPSIATTNIEPPTLLDYAGMLIANKKRSCFQLDEAKGIISSTYLLKC